MILMKYFLDTVVFVKMPANTTDSETITLRGPQEKHDLALTKVYEKFNSCGECVCELCKLAP